MTTQQTKTAVFTDFSRAVAARFAFLSQQERLYTVDLESDELWDAYQAAWPAGHNEIYRKRREHDCSCCRAFIRQVGHVVAIVDGQLETLWDKVELPYPYNVVAAELNGIIWSAAIKNVWLTSSHIIGTPKSLEQMLDGQVQTWNHFCVNVPGKFIKTKAAIPTALGECKASYDVTLRSLEEITVDALDTVLDLTAQNTLYRGSEFGGVVRAFKKLKALYDLAVDKPLFVWQNLSVNHRIRNTAVGTLLVDLSNGLELEDAVRKWEQIMAPTNYRRPTSLVTKQMITKAKEQVEQLGLTSALERRYATVDDITVNDLLYVERSVKVKGNKNAFDVLADAVPVKTKTVQSLDEFTINEFLMNVLPNVTGVELMLEAKHAGNFCSLIAPVDATARKLFKWDNAFSWSYAGDVTDSIKARVKAAGGSVTGDLRCSLSWFNYDDLDLHMIEASGNHIYYADRVSRSTFGQLDVDMNAGNGRTRSAVENITYPDRCKMRTGPYALQVRQFSQREMKDVGFDVEVEFDGQVFNLHCDKVLRSGEYVSVATISYDSDSREFTFKADLPAATTSKEVWGVKTHTFTKVNAIMHSPNYWDGAGDAGNKHFMFMLDGCKNPDTARGFYNEFLTNTLNEHRKVLEMVGAHMHTEQSDRQLSGLGFSSTQRNSVVVRCTGSFTRTIKINF